MRTERASGVLLHLTSLPGPHGSGDLGVEARHFVDWLVGAGQSCWQFLPLGGIGDGDSPYMSSSAFAGNPLCIDLLELQAQGWLDASEVEALPQADALRVDFGSVVPWRMQRLRQAAQRFAAGASAAQREDFAAFCAAQRAWLDDYALFMSLSAQRDGLGWADWEPELARRDSAALTRARAGCASEIAFWQFTQWCFERQWQALRGYANARGVRLIGDLPMFVALHSADVWAHPELFQLDAAGRPVVVAGVPPDDFSDQGQRWGNPLYRWDAHARTGYDWWIRRLRASFARVDLVRIDHFRGFESCWEIPAAEADARRGAWVAAPGAALFGAARAALGELPVIAEDLGIITPAVDALRRELGFPGMRVLQFGWGEGPGNDRHHLPHRYAPDAVVYPGTHDNDTSVGWWESASAEQRRHVRDYLACDGGDIAWSFIRAACASVAALAVYPMQDILRLGSQSRMNCPGTPRGNWGWRFAWEQVEPGHAALLARLCDLYGRAAPTETTT
jgi:4-alpha-glucanotransferase